MTIEFLRTLFDDLVATRHDGNADDRRRNREARSRVAHHLAFPEAHGIRLL